MCMYMYMHMCMCMCMDMYMSMDMDMDMCGEAHANAHVRVHVMFMLWLSINDSRTSCLRKAHNVYDRAVRAQPTPGLAAGATGAPQRRQAGGTLTFLTWECALGSASRRTRASRGSPAAGVRLPAVSTSVGGSPSHRVMIGVVRTC